MILYDIESLFIGRDTSDSALYFLIGIYSAPRLVRFDRACCEPFRVRTTIFAGDSFADLCMRLLLMPVLDEATSRWQAHSVYFALLADDAQFLVINKPGHAASVAQEVSDFLKEELWNQSELSIATSEQKLSVVTSSRIVRQRLRVSSSWIAKGLKRVARNLGTDFHTGGRQRLRPVRKARLKNAGIKLARLKRITKARGKTRAIAMMAIGAVAMFGHAVTGFRDSEITHLRKMYHSATVVKPIGRSVTADLAQIFGDDDPGVKPAIEVIFWMLTALWDGLMPRAMMRRVLSEAWGILRFLNDPWTQVKGPISAAVASSCALGGPFPRKGKTCSPVGATTTAIRYQLISCALETCIF